MKKVFLCSALIVATRLLWGGESGLTVTYQPLDGLGSGEIKVCQVFCHDWYGHSGQATAVALISAPNVPPTNNSKEATDNLNLASLCGVQFRTSDLGDPDARPELVMDTTKLAIARGRGYSKEYIVRACLECLRLVLPEKLRETPLSLNAAKADKGWLAPIVTEFNARGRRKVFYTPPE